LAQHGSPDGAPNNDVEFGRHLRERWLIDPDVTYLNHGTVGAPPKAVIERQREIGDEIERHPARFMLRELVHHDGSTAERAPRLRTAAAAVAPFVGIAGGDDLLFVENITTGANAVLRSFPFRPDDEIVVTSLGYGGVTNVARYVADDRGCRFRTIALPGPGATPAEMVAAVGAGVSDATRVLVIDHVTATTALVLPVAEIARTCHERGIAVLVDGAHVPGNIALDVESLGVDWYVANLHKWAWTPRSLGFLWVAPQHRSVLHPAVISWGLGQGLTAEFDLLGTRDPTAALTAPFALDLLRSYGADRVMRYNHDLAWWAAGHLSAQWDTVFDTPESMIGSMVAVRLPARLGSDDAAAGRVQHALDAIGIEVPVHAAAGHLTMRVSAQVYCDRSDIERLADAVSTLG
ncbi:MAG: aminotransferase class V-fold PLP-dependent enzyme, partial [Ilumatobacteraceae bacterium]